MFKRGGTAQGSGIMSTVEPKPEPRIMARMGFPTLGLSQAQINPETGMTAYEEMLARQTAPKFAEPRSIPYISGGGFSFLSPSTPSNVEAAPKISGGISDILTSNRAPVRSIPYIPGGGFGFLTPGGAKPIPRVQGETEGTPPGDFSDLLTDIERKEAPPPPPSDNKDGIGSLLDKGKKIDSRGKIKKEVEDETKFLKELLRDPDYEKGELALLVAEALRTPGGINKKLDTARKLGAKVAQGRREDDKAIKLAAYKLAKEKEKYETRYGQGTDYIRNLKEQAAYLVGRPGYEKKTADQIYGDLLAGKEDKAEARINILRSPQTAGEIKNVTDRISRLQVEKRTANEKRKKQIDEEIEQEKNSIGFITGMPEFNVIYQGLKEKYGFKTGGRVMKAEGGSMEDEDTEDTEDVENKIETTPISTGAGSTVTEPVQKLSYKELRDRLPQEITDDVVNLLANSEEALQEFAYIRTQEDVNGFNVKYGVNLVIPPVQG
jgi:hypothetical protein